MHHWTKLVATAAVATFGTVGTAAAMDAVSTADVNMRAGPGTEFPVVTTVPEHRAVTLHGCVAGYDWCDVSWADRRGWVFSDYLATVYNERRVPVMEYGARIDLPILSFSVGTYWDDHYRNEPWFNQRSRWADRFWGGDRNAGRGDRDWDRDRGWSRRGDEWRRGDGDRRRSDRDWGRDRDRNRGEARSDGDRYDRDRSGWRDDDERRQGWRNRDEDGERRYGDRPSAGTDEDAVRADNDRTSPTAEGDQTSLNASAEKGASTSAGDGASANTGSAKAGAAADMPTVDKADANKGTAVVTGGAAKEADKASATKKGPTTAAAQSEKTPSGNAAAAMPEKPAATPGKSDSDKK